MAELTGRKRFAHLYRRAGFGASQAELDAAIALDPNEDVAFTKAVDNLLNYQATPEVTDRTQPDEANDNRDSLILWWLERMVLTRRPLLEKMTFFWHDHFATNVDKDGIDTARMKRQNEFFRANALGNFESILNGISRDPAMMFWLDLVYNRRNSPNENYAREVMELFALGIGTPGSPNYTEDDIKQATRAFTGYSLDAGGNFVLNAGQHDGSTKTVLGQQCESGDQVHAILVRHQKGGRNVCAHFMAAKLFSFFAYPVTPDSAVVSGFAQTFVSSNLSIRALVEAILKSPQFSSNAAYRALVKSPVELGVGMLRALGGERIPNNLRSRMRDAGQRLFYPPDVSGWPSGQAWINASTLLQRCNMGALVVNSLGKTATSEAGGPSVRTHIEALPTGTAKVDRVASLLVDGDLPATARAALVTYANTATTDEKMRGLFNLAMAQPAYQLN